MISRVGQSGGTASAAGGNTYTIKSGDTMWDIAQQRGISLQSLIKANPQIKNPDLIFPGQQLNIPGGGRATGSLGGLKVSSGSLPADRPAALTGGKSGAAGAENSTPRLKGGGSVNYTGHPVSDPTLRNKIEQISDFFGRNVTITSGDRDYVPSGGSPTSLHLAHRAVDLHVDGLSDAEVFSRLKSSGLLNGGYEVIWHGSNTATGGPHIHIGRYGDGRASSFKLEGVPGRAGAGSYIPV